MIKKLVAKESFVDEGSAFPAIGSRYTYFLDEETGKWYEPVDGFKVTGDDLETLFIEVKQGE
jgi:hypothetical protein